MRAQLSAIIACTPSSLRGPATSRRVWTAAHVGRRYLALGTDGFGRSDTRAALREFFEVDRRHIAIAAIAELVREGMLDAETQKAAITRYSINVEQAAPWMI